MKKIFKKWDILFVDLNPVRDSEMAKTRPCMVIFLNSANKALKTVIVVPFTTSIKTIQSELFPITNQKRGLSHLIRLKRLTKAEPLKKMVNWQVI